MYPSKAPWNQSDGIGPGGPLPEFELAAHAGRLAEDTCAMVVRPLDLEFYKSHVKCSTHVDPIMLPNLVRGLEPGMA